MPTKLVCRFREGGPFSFLDYLTNGKLPYNIRHRALRVWCDRVFNFAFRLLLSDSLLIAYIRPPPWHPRVPAGLLRWSCAPPVCRLRKSLFLLQVLSNIHYFALWIHHIIHWNLNFCSTSLLIFTFSLSCKSITFRNSLKNLTKRKSRIVKKQQGFPSKLINLGLRIHLPKSRFRHHIFIKIWRCLIGIIQKTFVFITYSPHCFAKSKLPKP